MHVKPFLACLNESSGKAVALHIAMVLFVCVEVLRPSQTNGVISSVVSLPNHTFTGQALNQYCAHSFARN